MDGFLNSEYILRRLDSSKDISYLYDLVQKRLNVRRHSVESINHDISRLKEQYNEFIADRKISKNKNTNVTKSSESAKLESKIEELTARIAELENDEIQDYRKTYRALKEESHYLLSYYADTYSNPTESINDRHKEASDAFRKLASRLSAFSKGKAYNCTEIPTPYDLFQASRCLMGLSNGMKLNRGEDVLDRIDHNENLAASIDSILT